ncbi:class C sortase [Adlercreutzia sp. ZJ138]|uniref:class C sortase n=1 Tax=Adlercreutzia sp. ZJ138 TaxID=2709405 RepID=UPI0013EB4F09|nr:class C sortase [Adlercreutzia sp. ZJ138]
MRGGVSDGTISDAANSTVSNSKPPKKKRRVSVSNILIALALIAGIGIFCYPAVSDWWNSMHATRAIEGYQEVVAALTEEEKAALVAQARNYNAHLDTLSDRFSGAPSIHEEYEQAFNVTGNGLIGYVTVDKIDVKLPIYHGTSDGTLQTSAGHLEGSHLPTGDVGTHVVVSAHRGLPSAVLFTYLDEMHEGDYFSITVLDNEMFYQVDQVLIVEPAQIDALAAEDGTEYATLQTCTPYGVNSHRLLVRGYRVDGIPNDLADEYDARRVPIHIMAPAVAVPILLLSLIGLLIANRRKPARMTEADKRAVSLTPDGLPTSDVHRARDVASTASAGRGSAVTEGSSTPVAPFEHAASGERVNSSNDNSPNVDADNNAYAPANDSSVDNSDARREHHER